MDPIEAESTVRQPKPEEKWNPVDTRETFEVDSKTQPTRHKIQGLQAEVEGKEFAIPKMTDEARKEAMEEIGKRLEQGVKDQIISWGDHKELLEKFTTKGDFVEKWRQGKIQERIEEELAKFKKDRETFDRIQTDPRFYDGGIQQKGKEPIPVPDLKTFLEMPLKTRRAFIEKVRKALDKPVVGKKKASPETLRLKQDFQEKLRAEQKKGILGAKTLEKFMGYFNALDAEAKKAAFRNLDQILEPYAKLWAEIRKTVKGPPLKRLEGLRDSLDHEQLRAEFRKSVALESLKLEQEYTQKLEKANASKILPLHIKRGWEKSMKEATLDEKRKKGELLEKEMNPFAQLRREIDAAKDQESRKKMERAFNDPSKGLAEIQGVFGQITKGKEGIEQKKEGHETAQTRMLSEIRNARVKRAVENVRNDSTREEKQSILSRLKYYLTGKRSEDLKTFQQSIVQARASQKTADTGKSLSPKAGQPEAIKENAIGESEPKAAPRSAEKVAREAQKSSGRQEGVETTRINAKGTYVETQLSHGTEKDQRVRVVNMVLSDKQGREGFNQMQNPNSKTDKISFSTGKTPDDRELNLREMKVLEKVLAADSVESNTEKDEQVKKAA